MRSRFPSSFFVNLTSEHWESLRSFLPHSPAEAGRRSGRSGWAGLAGPGALRSRLMAKMTVVARMVATDPTRALKRMTMPVVLVSLPRPKGKATVTWIVVGPDEPEHQSQEDRRADQAAIDPEVADDRRPAPLVLVSHGLAPARGRGERGVPDAGREDRPDSPPARRRRSRRGSIREVTDAQYPPEYHIERRRRAPRPSPARARARRRAGSPPPC